MAVLKSDFSSFHAGLLPKSRERQQIETSITRMTRFIEEDDDLRQAMAEAPFKQGSFANNTLIRSVGNGWDVDLAYPVTTDFTSQFTDSTDALDFIARRFEEDPDYAKRLTRKTRCLQFNYSNDYHIDLVPMETQTRGKYPHHVADPPGWMTTTPREFDNWVHDINKDTYTLFARTMKFLKRWAALNFVDGERPPSILLTAFAGTHHPYLGSVRHMLPRLYTQNSRSDAAYITDTAVIMEHCISNHHGGFDMPNPVRPREDLAGRLTVKQLNALRVKTRDLAIKAKAAYIEEDADTSRQLWRRILGNDF